VSGKTEPDPDNGNDVWQAAWRLTGWTVDQLWLDYIAHSGVASFFDLDAYLAGLADLPTSQQDVLACTLNERLSDLQETLRLPSSIVLPEIPPGENFLSTLIAELRKNQARRQPGLPE
jgi:hypothetical protein